MLQDKTVEKTLKDLKTELKKLQRLREQTRAFLAAPETDPKFTAVLQKARRDVELKMEAFKVVEKQHKIKAFSTAGLAQAKEDPGARAKLACEEWLSELVAQANEALETYEGELEGLAAKGKRKKSERQAELEKFMQMLGNHVVRLEQVLRALDNDQVTVAELDELGLKDSLEYMLQSHMEPDFMDDDSIYEEIDLTEVAQTGKIAEHAPTKEKAKEKDAEAKDPKKEKKKKAKEKEKEREKEVHGPGASGTSAKEAGASSASANSAQTTAKVPGALRDLWKDVDGGGASSKAPPSAAREDRVHRLRPTGEPAGLAGGGGGYLRVAASAGGSRSLPEQDLKGRRGGGGGAAQEPALSSQLGGGSGPRQAGEIALEAAHRALAGGGRGGRRGRGQLWRRGGQGAVATLGAGPGGAAHRLGGGAAVPGDGGGRPLLSIPPRD